MYLSCVVECDVASVEDIATLFVKKLIVVGGLVNVRGRSVALKMLCTVADHAAHCRCVGVKERIA